MKKKQEGNKSKDVNKKVPLMDAEKKKGENDQTTDQTLQSLTGIFQFSLPLSEKTLFGGKVPITK